MALDLITFKGPVEVNERTAMTVRASFRDSEGFAGVQPSNVYYRLDDLGSGIILQDWTPLAAPVLPDNFVDVPLTAENNRILFSARDLERKQLSVMADRGLATQFVASFQYQVRNLGWSN